MKVIDELIKCSNGKPLLRKAKLENGVIFEYNGNSIVEQIIKIYGIHKDILNAKLEPIEEDTFEDIEQEERWDTGFIADHNVCGALNTLTDKINGLIRNQKKIISKLEDNQ